VREPVWIRDDVVRAIHGRQIGEHGGAPGVRDEGLLASALARSRNLLAYRKTPPDLSAMAAAYAFGIARNHPFIDGNKRVALVVCRTFLLLNGYDLRGSPADTYVAIIGVAEGRISERRFAAWIRKRQSAA
jgi:death-on-curing protein